MNDQCNLTYVLTTFNKIAFLKITVPLLIANCQPDEEIIITDGGSTDGTKEYLEQLFHEGKIQQFVSEKDKGEAHGFNKAILLASGELIKIITDDDLYSFTAIHQCKEFMLGNKNIDFLFSNIGDYHITDNIFFDHLNINNFMEWKKYNKPTPMCGLGLMLRRSSISLLGLFNPEYVCIDHEYSLKITNQLTCGSFYTGYSAIRILNEKSNSLTKSFESIYSQNTKLSQFYNTTYLEKQQPGILIRLLYQRITASLRSLNIFRKKNEAHGSKLKTPSPPSIEEVFSIADSLLANLNANTKQEFLIKSTNR